MFLLLKKIFRKAMNKDIKKYFIYKCPNCHYLLREIDDVNCYSIHCPKCSDLMVRD